MGFNGLVEESYLSSRYGRSVGVWVLVKILADTEDTGGSIPLFKQ